MLLFPNSSCIEKSHHISLHCSKDAKIFYMLYYDKMCEITQNYLF